MDREKTLEEIADVVGGRVIGDGSVKVRSVAGIEDASEGDITFVSNPRYLKYLPETAASAVIVAEGTDAACGKNLLVVKDPYLAFAAVLEVLKPVRLPERAIHPKAEIHPRARVGRNVAIQAYAVVEEGARVSDGVVIFPGVYVGPDVEIGEDSIIYANVSIRESTRIGKRVIIHCNSVIGSDGFGYAREGERHRKIPQTGIVRIEDDVEIGASVTIDRATMGETVIGRGTKIDNLVQIAHNVRIGEDSIIVAQVGVSGSTTIGSRVTLAGQTGVAGHISIADDCVVGAKSGVTNDIRKKGVYTGYPVIPHAEWLRAQGVFARLPEIRKRLLELERRLDEIEKTKGG